MTEPARIDAAERPIAAEPARLFDAFAEPASVSRWLPPDDMEATVQVWDFTPGGAFRMVLRYTAADHPGGKAGADHDEVVGRFTVIDPPHLVEQRVQFPSDDPAVHGEMIMRWTFRAAPGGTLARVEATGVPPGIDHDVHEAALAETLANLAREVEA